MPFKRKYHIHCQQNYRTHFFCVFSNISNIIKTRWIYLRRKCHNISTLDFYASNKNGLFANGKEKQTCFSFEL